MNDQPMPIQVDFLQLHQSCSFVGFRVIYFTQKILSIALLPSPGPKKSLPLRGCLAVKQHPHSPTLRARSHQTAYQSWPHLNPLRYLVDSNLRWMVILVPPVKQTNPKPLFQMCRYRTAIGSIEPVIQLSLEAITPERRDSYGCGNGL